MVALHNQDPVRVNFDTSNLAPEEPEGSLIDLLREWRWGWGVLVLIALLVGEGFKFAALPVRWSAYRLSPKGRLAKRWEQIGKQADDTSDFSWGRQ